ncbi:energy transducer TonB [Reichenbachiella ulvae]|uniref:Energy transducer TonB n=1 Tax=Reichenbachiella ulvae TaxID=2980104 RepID=A0ABT3CUY4_9BACT|nr:energy transducer TonB [Reichenbachiella ulvae]MCV9387505.1 energy transducer TonB [Reichenbachiella ulvae]
MKKIILLAFILSLGFSVTAQEQDYTFEQLEVQPEFKGGMSEFFKYIAKNMHYPADARNEGVQGKVLVQFVVTKTGEIDDNSIEVKQGLYPSLDEEAIRLIKECPDWIPGRITKKGEAAPTRLVIPIHINLR